MGSTTRDQSIILYFGDQTEKNIPFEELFEYSRESDRTKQFLQNAFHSIQLVIETLTEPERSKYKFDSFEEASKRLAVDSSPDVVLRTIVLCAAQLGYLIAILEKDPELREVWAAQKTLIVASCAGQLPAAIAACSHTIDELVDLAPETVAIAFRIGMDVDRRTASLGDDRSQSWAKAVFGVSAPDAQKMVDKFLIREGIDAKKGVYVAATSAWASTVVGPPPVLNLFFSRDPFNGARQVDLPITAIFHASHLDRPDTTAIIGTNPVFQGFSLRNPNFFSCSSGLPFHPQSLSALIEEAILNITHRMTDNEKMFREVQSGIEDQLVCIKPIVGESGGERLKKVLVASDAYVESASLLA
ncbi:hypothetical protein EYB25_004871 [Talaromyces marneffei]|uniref:uncharacterized protein n=1 Tax=Talaromyces marneffei TaxID=37727 RepID=UPI0012A95BAA|nr:uncharacterized protein EYB26_004063 [Talaromyces marneffei]KAE8553489.1 hypothetical protein EYB25_004871 [Talaromyces marneffei]QGA16396.1 hypothetical protein EYB26_004063 [Talaromyces marneffei]